MRDDTACFDCGEIVTGLDECPRCGARMTSDRVIVLESDDHGEEPTDARGQATRRRTGR